MMSSVICNKNYEFSKYVQFNFIHHKCFETISQYYTKTFPIDRIVTDREFN